MKYELLIFDLDGTLIDSKKDIAKAVNLTFREMGIPEKEPDEIYGYVGDGIRKLIKLSLGNGKEDLYNDALRIFRGNYLNHLLDTTIFFPGIDDVLDHYSKWRKAVVTNKSIEYTLKIIKGLKAENMFEKIVGGENHFKLKPDPDMLIAVLNDLRIDKEKAVMIGDSINDILAARSAGIKSCAVGYGFGDKKTLLELKPDHWCDKVEELKSLF